MSQIHTVADHLTRLASPEEYALQCVMRPGPDDLVEVEGARPGRVEDVLSVLSSLPDGCGSNCVLYALTAVTIG